MYDFIEDVMEDTIVDMKGLLYELHTDKELPMGERDSKAEAQMPDAIDQAIGIFQKLKEKYKKQAHD